MSDTQDPVPGYLIQQVISLCRESDDAVKDIQYDLFTVMRSPSSGIHQKIKSARATSILLQANIDLFRQNLWRRADDLEKLRAFAGKQDQICGDALNEQFRKLCEDIYQRLTSGEGATAVPLHELAYRIVGLSHFQFFQAVRCVPVVHMTCPIFIHSRQERARTMPP